MNHSQSPIFSLQLPIHVLSSTSIRAISVNNNIFCFNVMSMLSCCPASQTACSLRNESVFQGNVHTVQTSQLAETKLNCNAAAPGQ